MLLAHLQLKSSVRLCFIACVLVAFPCEFSLRLGLTLRHLPEHDLFVALGRVLVVAMGLVISIQLVLGVILGLVFLDFREVFRSCFIILVKFL